MATYSQDWTAGVSDFTTITDYIRDDDGVDALYPEIYASEGVDVSGGKVVKAAAYGDHQASGVVFAPGNAAGLGHPANDIDALSAQQGSISVKMTPNSAVLTPSSVGISYVPVIEVFAGNAARNLVFALYSDHGLPFTDKGAPFYWDISARDRNTSVLEQLVTAVATPTFVDGQEYTFKVCWKCGTFNGVTTDADGYVKFTLDGVVIHEELNFPLVLNNASSANNAIHGYISLSSDVVHGGGGLFGSMGDVLISDTECTTTRQSVIIGRGAAADDKAKVTSDLTVLANLDGLGRTVHEPNTFYIAGHLKVTGTTTFEGDVVTSTPETLMNSIVTTGSEIVLDSDGNIVFVNGS